ncbi:polyprenyl synthetase family protein [Caldivirga maquilingensis]|uniref:Polyprenyl synthetase n=1 Tax=Caldivirga maquilingensis (strain ATCC 700844 / DSM 13496 / JCM 10307 / IC-167) TaxID=397948 RepID=A8MC39_CALMQ|nr:polyprenyl synthetase family protein [Caldivirga maquilingensis]ABW01345.1 Polyprenyl synthetase [Caldivirga maquilingensis IC-167]
MAFIFELPKEINDVLSLIINELGNLLNGVNMPPNLRESAMHYIHNKGKMIRPLLTLITTHTLGGNLMDAVNPAIAVELVHVATLLQDDIIDGHLMRRGSETPFKRYGTEYTILASDLLIAKAIEYSLKSKTRRITMELTSAALRLAIGQSYELEYKLNGKVDMNIYMRIIENKTASLISAAIVLGGYVADADSNTINLLRSLGEKLGAAYQIRDDIIDYLNLDKDNPKGLRSVDVNVIDALKAEGFSDPLKEAYRLFMGYMSEARAITASIRGGEVFAGIIDFLQDPLTKLIEGNKNQV